MNFPKFTQEQIKLALSGSAGAYALVGGALLGLGALHLLESIPLLSPVLEVLGLVYAYQNRDQLFQQARNILAPASKAAVSAVLPEVTED